MTTYTTTCPPEWGLGTSAVILTVPAPTVTATVTASSGAAKTGSASVSGKASSAYADPSSSLAWNEWKNGTDSSATWTSSTKSASATGTAASLTSSSTAAASATIKPYKGAASSSFGAVSKVGLTVVVGALMAVLL